MTWTIATTQPPPRATKANVREMATLFLFVLSLAMVVLIVSLILLRLRVYRRRLHRGKSLEESLDQARAEAARPRVDPWTEAGRRVTVAPTLKSRSGDDDDTVDIDPEDLGPDDIGPEFPPESHNGTGPHLN